MGLLMSAGVVHHPALGRLKTQDLSPNSERCRGQALEARPVREGQVAASVMGFLSLEFPFAVSG